MKGIYWRTLTFKKGVIYLIKVNYTCTANVNRQTTDKLLFSYAIITGENV